MRASAFMTLNATCMAGKCSLGVLLEMGKVQAKDRPPLLLAVMPL